MNTLMVLCLPSAPNGTAAPSSRPSSFCMGERRFTQVSLRQRSLEQYVIQLLLRTEDL
ncbi:hypothetical protein DPMN_136614 [Dreissena polymorpha]|uniref:Uncharacterized protein n=1 Tax=Dreissena polymorpha TaxID=45954 RepID=A0A9D4G149_DREPO|nr:hypothetical protein DPMN_136614 [Dreissena polymorpha]